MLISVLGMFARSVVSGIAWKYILEALGNSITSWQAIRIRLVTHFGKYLPGFVWGYAGIFYFCRQLGIPNVTASISMLYDAIFFVASAVLTFLSCSLVTMQPGNFDSLPFVLIFAALGLLVVLQPVLLEKLLYFFMRRMGQEPIMVRLKPVHVVKIMATFCLGWVGAGIGFYCFVASITGRFSFHFAMAMGGFAIAWATGFLAPLVPSGLGVREGILTALLAGHFGLAVATTISLLARLWTTGCELVSAAVAWAPTLVSCWGKSTPKTRD